MTDPFSLHPLNVIEPLAPDEACFGTFKTLLGHLPLQAMQIQGRLCGLSFRLVLTQTFHNSTSHNLEAVYIFPLPARAAVSRFVMRTQNREVVGRLKERGEARRDYDQALRAGHQAGLVEEDRPEVFTMKVGNLPAGEQVEVELTLTGPLAMADGMATFRFPLVVAPRFMPGQALDGPNVGEGMHWDTDATPDASRISPPVLLPGYPNPVRLSIELGLDLAGLKVRDIYTSLPQLLLERDPEGTPVLRLAPATGQLKADLIVRLPVLGPEVQGCVQQVQDRGGKAFTWSLTLLPPEQQQLAAPRNLVVLVDRSGSMGGWKMTCARRAAGRIIDSFHDRDRFAALTFDSIVEDLSGGRLLEARDRARFQAAQALSRVEARGGTELAEAVVVGLRRLQQAPDGVKYLILITDGQVGNEDQILREIQRHGQGVRIFCVGIDQAVNHGLLMRIARESGGTCELVESKARLEEVMEALRRRLGGPVLTQVELEAPKQAAAELAPTCTDLYPGLPARLYGRALGGLPKKVWVRGRDAEGHPWRRQFPVQTVQQAPFRLLWAREVILELEHGFVIGKSGANYKPKAITRLSLAHHVLSRFTAFVAVDESSQVGQGQLLQVVQPVDLPAGWDSSSGMVGSTTCDIANLLCDRSARSSAICESRVNTSDALERLAKEKPGKVAELLKSTWLGSSPARGWRECLEELRKTSQPEQRRRLLQELLKLLQAQSLTPELLARGQQILEQDFSETEVEEWLEEVEAALEPTRQRWWR